MGSASPFGRQGIPALQQITYTLLFTVRTEMSQIIIISFQDFEIRIDYQNIRMNMRQNRIKQTIYILQFPV